VLFSLALAGCSLFAAVDEGKNNKPEQEEAKH